MAQSVQGCLQIGLTGSIGMGKSTIAKQFRSLGFPVFDADAVVHSLYAQGGDAVPLIKQVFPEAVVDGAVSRPELSKYVLNDSDALRMLEGIVHPLVRREREAFYAQMAEQGQLLVLYDIPLLFENPQAQLVDYTIVASAGSETQKERVLARPNMTPEKLKSILSKQLPDTEKRRLSDFVILTDVWPDSYAPAKSQVARVLENIFEREPARWSSWTNRSVSYSEASNKHGRGSGSATGTGTVSRIKEAFDLVLLDLDDTLVPVLPPLTAAAQVLSTFLQSSLPRVHALLLSEGSGNISRALGARMKLVSAHLPLMGHDLTELRRLALLDALRESKGLPPVLGAVPATTNPTSAAAAEGTASGPGSPRLPRSPSKGEAVPGLGSRLSPERIPDQSPFRQKGRPVGNIMADEAAIKRSADSRQAAGAGSMSFPGGYHGLIESEVNTVQTAMQRFLEARSDIAPHLYPDALPCLEFFQAQGLRLGVVTNGNAELGNFLDGRFFGNLCVTSGDAGALKPSLVPFVAAAQLADVAPSRVLFIGDALDKDVAGANVCGMVSCWLNRDAERGVFAASNPKGGGPAVTLESLEPAELQAKLFAFLDARDASGR